VERIEVPGSPVVVEIVDGSYYRVSFDGATFSRTLPLVTDLALRSARFDPLTDGVPAVPAPLAAPSGAGAYVVQFVTPLLAPYDQGLEALGAQPAMPLHHQGQIVRMDASTAAAVAALPYVRWVGPYPPAYKLEGELAQRLAAGTGGEVGRYNILLLERGLAAQLALADFIAGLGGIVETTQARGFRMEATLDDAQLLAVARRDEVLFIDRWSPPELDLDIAREISGANFVEAIGGYTGDGVRAEVMDSGLRTSHGDFQSPPPLLHGVNGSFTSHGTSVYGIVFGDGTGDPTARGIAPDAFGIFSSYNTLNTVSRYTHTEELVDPVGPYRAVFQTNSWGDARTFFYTNISAEMDDILFQNDIVITQSQSNAGNQDSRPQAWAKNIVAVGGIRHMDTLTRSDDQWSFGASIGPASDGRIKPDLSHFYDATRAPSSSCDACYTTFGGTSGATPITAGHFALFFQMWADGVFSPAGAPDGGDVFDLRPHMTTAKALMINTAEQYAFSGVGHDLTRTHQGWGFADARGLYESANCSGPGLPLIIDESAVIEPLAVHSYPVEVTVGPQPSFMKATLVYADPMGNPAGAVHRINDLTLRVTSPTGTVYWGNNGLLEGNWSTPGGDANTIDTVENVFVEQAEPGTWTVEVLADEIVQDSHLETPELDADYALVVTTDAACDVAAAWDEPLCDGEDSTVVEVAVCNFEETVQSYVLNLKPRPAGGQGGEAVCTVAGPTVFQDERSGASIPPGAVVSLVGPQSCRRVPVRIFRPAGMTALGDVGCFEAVVTNAQTGAKGHVLGSLQDRRDLCGTSPTHGVASLPGSGVVQVDFVITNTSATTVDFDWLIEERPADHDPDHAVLSLDGNLPGTPVGGFLSVAPGGQETVSVDVEVMGGGPFDLQHLVLLTDTEGLGDFQPLTSRAFRLGLPFDYIFADGFESGDTSGWANVVPVVNP
jgi:subtilisin family serine protease